MPLSFRLLLIYVIFGHRLRLYVVGAASCEEPYPVANAYRDWEGGDENTWVRYACMDSYDLLEGDLQRQCVGGSYNGTPPVCLLNCGPPLNYTHAVSELNGTMSEDVAQYACVGTTNYTQETNEMICDPAPGRWEDPIHCAEKDQLSHNIIFRPLSTQGDMDSTNEPDTSASESISHSSTDFYGEMSSSAVFSRISASILTDTYGTSVDVTQTTGAVLLQPSETYTTDIQPSSQSTGSLTAIPSFNDVTSISSDVIMTSESVVVAPSEVNETCPRQNRLIVDLEGGPYEVLHVVLVRPPDEDIFNFRVDVASPPTECFQASRLLYEDRTTIPCSPKRLFPQGDQLVIRGSNPDHGTLRICDVEVYGRVPSVDCGIPNPYPGRRAVYTTTSLNSSAIYYCSATYHFRGGKQWVNCSKTGYWENYSLWCSDKEKIDPANTSNNTNPAWFDNDVTTCSPVNGSDIHVTLDLGSKYEVKMVTITTHLNSSAASLTFNVLRDGLSKECQVTDPPYYTHESGEITVAVRCIRAPVGESLELLIGGLNGSLCEIKVFGRPFSGEPIECLQLSNGREYKGTLNMTVTGQECQAWQDAAHDLSEFPDMTWDEAGSSCRNPDGRGSPWCYTDVTSGAKEDCPIVSCDLICLRYPDGVTYRGKIQKTETGASCLPWSDDAVEFKRTALFPWSSLSHSNCRNPTSSMTRPWCYTSSTLQFDYCAVPTCPVESEYTTTYYRLDHTGVLEDFVALNFSHCFLWTMGDNSATHQSDIAGLEERVFSLCGTTHSLNMTILCETPQAGRSNWSYAIFECVDCGIPSKPDNMEVHYTSTFFPSDASYTCGTGYVRDTGTGNFTCLSIGDWDNATLECIVDCSAPSTVPGTNLSFNVTTLGSLAEYVCLLTNETVNVSCTDSGKWQLPVWQTRCLVDCGIPSQHPNTNVTFNLTYTDDTAVYACVGGYVATSGTASAVCQDDGKWTTPSLDCKVDCLDPPDVTNMTVVFTSTVRDETAQYSCATGLQAAGGTGQVTCGVNGAWGSPTLICKELEETSSDDLQPSSTSSFLSSSSSPDSDLSYFSMSSSDHTSDSTQIDLTSDLTQIDSTPSLIQTESTSATPISASPTSSYEPLSPVLSDTSSSPPSSSPPPTSPPPGPTTPSPPPGPTTPSHCPPRCVCARMGTPDSVQIELIKQQIANSLLIDVKTLSKEKRKLTSASDGRTSAAAIGHSAWIFMVVVFGLLFLSDMVNLVRGVIVIVTRRSRRFRWSKD